MPFLTLLLGSTGVGAMGGLGALARYLRMPEDTILAAQFAWHKAAFYEAEPQTELDDDVWDRVDVLAKKFPGQTATEYKVLAVAEQAQAIQDGWKPPSEVIDSLNPKDGDAMRSIMREGAESLAMQDGTTKRLSTGSKPSRARRAATTFLRHWIAATRQQFEMRQDRPSDRAAMRTWLGKELRGHGVRITHVSRAVPLIVRLALLPDEGDRIGVLSAEEVRPRTRWGRYVYNFQSWWSGLASADPQTPAW